MPNFKIRDIENKFPIQKNLEFFNRIDPEPTFSQITVKVKYRHTPDSRDITLGGKNDPNLPVDTQNNVRVVDSGTLIIRVPQN